MPFLEEPEPRRGPAHPVADGVRRVVANNPGPMTYWGTNTYLLDTPDGLVILDPGPDDPSHVRAVLDAAPGPVSAILLSHTHKDHLGAVPAVRAATGAPVHAWHQSPMGVSVEGFAPDIPLHDGDRVAGLLALHTPGHASDHLCFARDDGALFSADHVMSWSSSVVSPPDGDMVAYFGSLNRLLARDDRLLLPGHGPPMPQPHDYIQNLLDHRQAREDAILDGLRAGPQTAEQLTDRLYHKLNPWLQKAAHRNVLAHLAKLAVEGQAADRDGTWQATPSAM